MNAAARLAAASLALAGAWAQPFGEQQEPGPESGTTLDLVSFHADVLPILQRSCQGCHQPARAEDGLVLTGWRELMHGADGDPIVVPGEPDASLLVNIVTPFDDLPPEMPEDGEPLTRAEREVLARWVLEGALDDTPEGFFQPYTREHPPIYPRPPVVTSLAFSPDGQWLAVSGTSEVLVHRADGSELAARLIGLSERIESIAFSPDGERLAVAGGSPGRRGELQIWRTADFSLERSIPTTYDTIYGASWSPDGSLVAYGCADTTLRAVEVKSGAEVLYQNAHADWVLGTAFSSDGSHLLSVSRDRSLKLVKIATQQFIDNVTSITPGALKGGLMALARHPERDELLVGGADGVPKIYRAFREQKRVIGDDYNLIRAFEPLPGRVFAVAWSPDGARVAAASSDRSGGVARGALRVDEAVIVDEAQQPVPPREGEPANWRFDAPAGVYAVAFHPSGDVVAAGGADGLVRLFDAADGALVRELVPVPLEGSVLQEAPLPSPASLQGEAVQR